jgi:hypothetical protein
VIDQLAARLTALGERHAGVHWASIGWILPELHDPDGHEVRFYTLQQHTDPVPRAVITINDPGRASSSAASGPPLPDRPPPGGARARARAISGRANSEVLT